MTKRSVVVGVGSYLPKQVMTNQEIAQRLDTSHEWIVERTGIHSRHIAQMGEFTSHLGAHAAREALANANLTAADIDVIVLATTTPDETMPSTATKVQHLLGMKQGAGFDVNAACSGFVYALHVADGLVLSGKAKRALVIGAETFSRILDWNDRGTCILFGDGAGAVILEAHEGKGDNSDRGILHTSVYSDGEYIDILKTTGGVSSSQTTGYVTMAGKEVFRHAVEKMSGASLDAMKKMNIDGDDVDWIVPHQANYRILSSTAKKLNIQEDKLISTVKHHANTSAASIPLALTEAQKNSRIQKGNLIVIPALGAGLTWGTCILRW
jgi:3-oxoacyl-[acyl-carrier-protein] synthase-3